MAIIKPFKAIRPVDNLVNRVASLPYDVLTTCEAREIAQNNPYSFLHVDKAEIDLPEDTNLYDEKVYAKAKENLNNMIKDNVLIQDETECLYIYRLVMYGVAQTGLVVCTSIDDYLNGTIKKHELTREDKETDRINHITACNANTGPVFLAYHENLDLTKYLESWVSRHNPRYSFKDNNISQQVWVINDLEAITYLINEFKSIPNFYIADGHHRCAAAVKVGLNKRDQNPNYTGNEEFNYFLSVLFPSNQLHIYEYNRVVKDLNGLTEREFLAKLEAEFEIENNGSDIVKLVKPRTFGVYLNKTWYYLSLKDNSNLSKILDVTILQQKVLEPILNIVDPKTDKRIDFVGGIKGEEELINLVDSGEMKVAFSLFPVDINQLMLLADDDKIMPPKSTWFEPKLRSGIFIHLLD